MTLNRIWDTNFKFENHSLPGIKTVIHCEVVELDKPKRLAYTWQDEITSEPTLVIWTFTTVEGGTQLRLKHLQTGSAAISVRDRHRFNQINNSHNLYQQTNYFPSANLTSKFASNNKRRTNFRRSPIFLRLALSSESQIVRSIDALMNGEEAAVVVLSCFNKTRSVW